MARFGRRARVGVVLLAALVVAATPGIAAGAGGAPGPAPSEVDAAAAFRSKLGLRSDRPFVGSTFGKASFSSAAWGVPLDPAEAAEVGRRADAQKAVARALRAWTSEPGSAGAYVDQRAGGIAVFLTTGDPARARRGIAPHLPAGAPGSNVRFERVRYSTAELLTLQERINADLGAGALGDLGVSSTAIDARANAVVVGVEAANDEVRAGLAERYGDAIQVTFEPAAQGGDAGGCLSRKDCPPAKAGIEIRSSYNGNSCTTGFLVRVVGSSEPRILTAGHCIGQSGGTGTSRKWTQAGRVVGWAELAVWTGGADADVALLNPAAGAIEGDRNLIYRASNVDLAPITGWALTADQVQGGLVCRAGATSGYRCGTIALTNRTRAVDGPSIDHQWVVDFDACPGDSGGPYVLGGVAYGVHADSSWGCEPSRNQAWYSPMGWALKVLQDRGHPVELCTTATCGMETNVWTPRGSLAGVAWDPRLVSLPDGRVLGVGGTPGPPFATDAGSGAGIADPQVYDPATGLWSDTAAPPWAPASCEGQFAVGLGDGRVLVGGGRRPGSGDPGACRGAYVVDPAAEPEDAWQTVADPPVELVSAGAVLLDDGRAFVTGGSGPDGATSVVLAFEPVTGEWEVLAPAPAGALAPLVLRLADGRVLVSGGYVTVDGTEAGDGGIAHVAATHLYDPATGSWSSTDPVGAQGMAGAVLANGRVVVAGGRHLRWDGTQHAAFVQAVTRLDPVTGAWTELAPLPSARAGFTLAELPNGLVLAAGGSVPDGTVAGEASRTADAYHDASKAWYPAPTLEVARAGQGSVVLADGTVLVAGGGTASTETYVAGDVLPPSASAPTTALRSGAQMGASAIPIRLAWSATDAGVAGVGTFDIARSTDGGSFTTIATSVTTRTFDTTVGAGHVYRYQVRPRDWAGNVGAWRAGTSVRLAVREQAPTWVSYGGLWKIRTVGGYSGGSVRSATTRGAAASFAFTGRGVSFVTTRGPSMGSAKIYVDGVYAGTVNLHSATWKYRYVAFQRTWSSAGSHRIKVVVVGTSGHPRVDVDAFVVLSTP